MPSYHWTSSISLMAPSTSVPVARKPKVREKATLPMTWVDRQLGWPPGSLWSSRDTHVKREVVQPIAQVTDAARIYREAADFLQKFLLRLLDAIAEILHRCQTVWRNRDTLHPGVLILLDLRKYIRIFRWRKYGVKISLLIAFSGSEDLLGCNGRGERDLVWCDSHHSACVTVHDGYISTVTVLPEPERERAYRIFYEGLSGRARSGRHIQARL
jgi:hypothetical protein